MTFGLINIFCFRKYTAGLIGFVVALIFAMLTFVPVSVHAQSSDSVISLESPVFDIKELTADKAEIAENVDLTPEQIKQGQDFYDTAITRLRNAERNLETAKTFSRELTESPRIVEMLQAELDAARVPEPEEPEDVPMEGPDLLNFEQELIAQESKLRGLRAEVERYNTQLETLLQRPVAARDELADARVKLSEINSQIDGFGSDELSAIDRARLSALQARKYFRQAQILALEQETGSRVSRQDIITLRRDIAQEKVDKTSRRVVFIQRKTGQSRLNEASRVHQINIDALAVLNDPHPFVGFLAKGNVDLSQRLKDAASESSRFPRQEAATRDQLKVVNDDLAVARQLINLGDLDRQSSKTLRRLRDKGFSPKAINASMEKTRSKIVQATQDRLLAEEEFRNLTQEDFNMQSEVVEWKSDNPEALTLTDVERGFAENFYSARRDLLTNIAKSSRAHVEDLITLEGSQGELLRQTVQLKELLDQNLLWLPSVPAIDMGWPGRIVRGVREVVSVEHMTKAIEIPVSVLPRAWVLLFVLGTVIVASLVMRTRLSEDIQQRAQEVGRVQKDSYWHTPNVIVACFIIALPIPMMFWGLSLLYRLSNSADAFIVGMASALQYLAFFTLFFLTWREWNRDKSLFGTHYKLPRVIRNGIYKQFTWFIPVAAISSSLVVLTDAIPEPDVYEGVSVLAFIITALSLSVFAFRLLWNKREAIETYLSKDSAAWKYRQPVMVLLIGLPIFAALLAGAGYYETASELLRRLFISGLLLIGTYVVYGLIRRTLMVARRRLHLRQAIERRDKALRARKEKEAAEERGDIPPPPNVDYDEIDVESMSRQTAKLLYTAMAFGFAFLMWLIWSDLLPALSSFNRIELWDYAGVNSEGESIQIGVTLWSVIQVLVVIFLTYIAAKNLPGFLEISVLNRAGVDAGTRYAIVTILGYIIVAIGVLMVFDRLGLEWSKLQWLVAGLGVGIGFGLQEIIANFISGLIILFERPVRIGDYVTIGDQSGTVSRIQIRAITISDLDSRETLIPNKELITGRVTNWTLTNTVTRIKIPVGVAYGSDTEKVHGIIMDVLSAQTMILEKPAPQAMFLGFGDSSLDFEIRVFIKAMEDRFPVQHSIHTDLNKAFEKEGISIPFPQRDLHVITQSVPVEVVPETPKAKPKPKPKSTPKPKTT